MATRAMTTPRSSGGRLKWLVVGGLLAIVTFLSGSGMPLGGFWAPSQEGAALIASATGAQFALFVGLKLAEAVAFGAGITFLLFGYGAIRDVSPTFSRAAHLAIVWVLANWWVHDSLHIHFEGAANGPGPILAIEYGFHLTLMIAGGLLAVFFARLVSRRA